MTLSVLINSMQTVLLLGGISGVGKSTLAMKTKALYGEKCYNFDFGQVYGGNDSPRDWETEILTSINAGLDAGYELVVANSTFIRRQKRNLILDNIFLRVIPIIMRPPILVAHHHIKDGRPEGTHPTNAKNSMFELGQQCKIMIKDDQSDILLPTDHATLPAEYRAILLRNEANRHLLLNQEYVNPSVRWVTAVGELTPTTCVGLVNSGTNDPYEIRNILESSMLKGEGNRVYGIEGRSISNMRNRQYY